MAKSAEYFTTLTEAFDVDLELKEVRDNPDENWTIRALSGHSVGMPLDDGYLAACELGDALEWVVAGCDEGKARLAAILGNGCDDYQRLLYYTIAGRGPFGVIADLPRLVVMMKTRMDVGHQAESDNVGLQVAMPPYPDALPEGPLGRFDAAFTLAPGLADFGARLGGNGASD